MVAETSCVDYIERQGIRYFSHLMAADELEDESSSCAVSMNHQNHFTTAQAHIIGPAYLTVGHELQLTITHLGQV